MSGKAPTGGDDDARTKRERSAPINVERLDLELEEELFSDLHSARVVSRRRHSSAGNTPRQSFDTLVDAERETGDMAPGVFCVEESSSCGLAGSLLSNTPPGVVTKVERFIRLNDNSTAAQLHIARSPSAEKRLCGLCHRKAFCLCERCAAEKCDLYKMRTKQTTLEAEKRRLVAAIDAVLNEQTSLTDQLSDTSCTVGHLRTLLAFKRHNVRRMRQQLRRAQEFRNIMSRYAEKLAKHITTVEQAIENRASSISTLHENMSKKELRLQAMRQRLARRIFNMFPVATVDDVRSSTDDSAGALSNALAEATATSFINGRWTVLDSETDDDASTVAKYLTIVGCRVPDDSDYRALKTRLMSESTSVAAGERRLQSCQSWMAALGYAMQLVNRLSVVYDIFLPFEISHRDLALADSWTEPLLDTDVFKLNACVLLMCLARGLPADALSLRRPFRNLLILSQCLSSGGTGLATRIPSDLALELRRASEKLDWREHERASMPQHSPVEDWEQVSGDELPVIADYSDRRPSGLTDLLTSATASVANLFRS